MEDAAIGRLSFARSPSRPFLINKSPLSRESLNELQGLGAGDSSGLGLDDFQLDRASIAALSIVWLNERMPLIQ